MSASHDSRVALAMIGGAGHEFGARHTIHYLALLNSSALSERALAAALWPDDSTTAGRSRLRQFRVTDRPDPLVIAALAEHFGVTMESFFAPVPT